MKTAKKFIESCKKYTGCIVIDRYDEYYCLCPKHRYGRPLVEEIYGEISDHVYET